jgi:hypothetical protein
MKATRINKIEELRKKETFERNNSGGTNISNNSNISPPRRHNQRSSSINRNPVKSLTQKFTKLDDDLIINNLKQDIISLNEELKQNLAKFENFSEKLKSTEKSLIEEKQKFKLKDIENRKTIQDLKNERDFLINENEKLKISHDSEESIIYAPVLEKLEQKRLNSLINDNKILKEEICELNLQLTESEEKINILTGTCDALIQEYEEFKINTNNELCIAKRLKENLNNEISILKAELLKNNLYMTFDPNLKIISEIEFEYKNMPKEISDNNGLNKKSVLKKKNLILSIQKTIEFDYEGRLSYLKEINNPRTSFIENFDSFITFNPYKNNLIITQFGLNIEKIPKTLTKIKEIEFTVLLSKNIGIEKLKNEILALKTENEILNHEKNELQDLYLNKTLSPDKTDEIKALEILLKEKEDLYREELNKFEKDIKNLENQNFGLISQIEILKAQNQTQENNFQTILSKIKEENLEVDFRIENIEDIILYIQRLI